jgi:serine/threonine protein phosphatase 1
MKTFVIGDIHGGLKALLQVLQAAQVSSQDRLIFLGDYVDGWSESAQTISFLIDLAGKQESIFIKGNHDVWCEDWLRNGQAPHLWLAHGGKETVESYKNINDTVRRTHLEWLERMPYYIVDAQNRLFIHAGFTSMHGPEKEFHSSNFSWDRTLWEMAITMDKSITKDSLLYPKRLKLYQEIFIGHTPTLYYDITTPMQGCNVWNLDTGAAFKGRLSIMDITSKTYWQSDPVWKLYPGEHGRNGY